MVTIDQLRDAIAEDLEQDKQKKTVEVWGTSVEDALKQASIELETPVSSLEYEILIQGSAGFLGALFKKEWQLLVYPSFDYTPRKLKKHKRVEGSFDEEEFIQTDRDGDFGISFNHSGQICLRVIAPIGSGSVVTKDAILNQIKRTKFMPDNYDSAIIDDVIKKQTGEWVVFGEYQHNSEADSKVTVIVSDDDMKASISLTTPANGGATASFAEMREALTVAGVLYGVKEDALKNLENHPVYRNTVIVAEGELPHNGDNTKIKFLFETDFSKAYDIKMKGDVVDFKNNSQIQSVQIGEVVAKIISPEQGKPGHTVTGTMLAAKDGDAAEIPLGNNVRFSDDHTEIIATAAGQALFVKGVVSVETINVIEGNLKSHINFSGSLVIKGDIGDGYEVSAQGDIYVTGTVGRSRLQAGGNIIVDGGVNGSVSANGEEEEIFHVTNISGSIKCGKNFRGRFLQNCTVEAGEFVIVSDGILHSQVIGLHKVLCKGKRASIVGGSVRASEEINAAAFGSVSGTPTFLEVGFDPRLKDELNSLIAEREIIEKELTNVSLNLKNWLKAASGKTLPPDKQKRITDMQEEKVVKEQQVIKLTESIKVAMDSLKEKEITGKISASKRVFPGVQISIDDALFDVTNEFSKGVTFFEREGLIHTRDYEDITDDISQ